MATKVTSSYKVKLMDHRKLLEQTVQIYRKAVVFLMDIANKEWNVLGPVYKKQKNKAQMMLEHMVHATKNNPNPKYNFDTQFYKFPSYFRRAALSTAIGAVAAYYSNLKNWEENGKNGKQPTLSFDRTDMPTFFKKEMSNSEEMLQGKQNIVLLKLFQNNDWVFVPVHCRNQDVKYLVKWWSTVRPSAPSLIIRRRKGRSSTYYLQYAFTEYRDLSLRDEESTKQTILAVDLGLNCDAVCSVMRADGTVMARRFINFPREKDRMYHLLNRIKRLQRQHNRTGGKHEWAKVKRINDHLSQSIASAIVNMASEYAVNVIVFEHLESGKKGHGKKKQRLHLWRKNGIQNIVEHKAHRDLIRISRICAWGTSKLAFDGSGEVKRNADNYSLCVFKSGKHYNSDLNASYNIGARYFLREMCKVDPELVEKLPKTSRRTYADLKNLKLTSAS